jgi:hypothetical protein
MDTTSRSFDRAEQLVYRRYKRKYKRIVGEQPLVHRYKKAVAEFNEIIRKGELKNAFKDSDLSELAIVTVHNYDESTLFEDSLDYLGVTDYTVLRHEGEWRMALKYVYLLEFLETCEKPYVLFCDARDTALIDDPAKILPLFKKFRCEAVFNSTMSPRGIFKSYPSCEPLYWWSRYVSRTGWRKRFANAGSFIGKKQFIKEISEVILFYCESMKCEHPPESDQDVLRAIYPWYWPRMMVDYYNRIVYRN